MSDEFRKVWPDGSVTLNPKLKPVDGLWPVERVNVPDLAAILYAQVTWGREPHPAQVSPLEMEKWESEKPRWIAATQKMLDAMAEEKQIAWWP